MSTQITCHICGRLVYNEEESRILSIGGRFGKRRDVPVHDDCYEKSYPDMPGPPVENS